jgi:hypothetical protein
MIAAAEYAQPNTFRLDPYFRDEAGKFVRKPEIMPAPVAAVIDVSGGNKAVFISADPLCPNYWRVRCVKTDNGTWRVVYEDSRDK